MNNRTSYDYQLNSLTHTEHEYKNEQKKAPLDYTISINNYVHEKIIFLILTRTHNTELGVTCMYTPIEKKVKWTLIDKLLKISRRLHLYRVSYSRNEDDLKANISNGATQQNTLTYNNRRHQLYTKETIKSAVAVQ